MYMPSITQDCTRVIPPANTWHYVIIRPTSYQETSIPRICPLRCSYPHLRKGVNQGNLINKLEKMQWSRFNPLFLRLFKLLKGSHQRSEIYTLKIPLSSNPIPLSLQHPVVSNIHIIESGSPSISPSVGSSIQRTLFPNMYSIRVLCTCPNHVNL